LARSAPWWSKCPRDGDKDVGGGFHGRETINFGSCTQITLPDSIKVPIDGISPAIFRLNLLTPTIERCGVIQGLGCHRHDRGIEAFGTKGSSEESNQRGDQGRSKDRAPILESKVAHVLERLLGQHTELLSELTRRSSRENEDGSDFSLSGEGQPPFG
jgi:hypothetical protein